MHEDKNNWEGSEFEQRSLWVWLEFNKQIMSSIDIEFKIGMSAKISEIWEKEAYNSEQEKLMYSQQYPCK